MIPAVLGGIAAVGSLANAYNTYNQGKNAEEMYNRLAGQAAEVEKANAADIASYQNFLARQYGGDAAKYSKALEDFMNSPVFQNEGFGYKGEINDYLDPARNQRLAATMNAIERQGADGGNSFSSDYMNRLAGQVGAQASEEWQNAYNRLVQDRSQQLAAYNANSQNNWNNYNAQTQRQEYGLGQYGGARDAYANGYGSVLAAGMQNRQAGLQSQANAMGGVTNAQNQANSWAGQLVGPAAQFIGAYYGSSK